MKVKRIDEEKARAGLKYEVARQIRELLDQEREGFGPEAWDDEDLESQILELVTGEDAA